MNLLRGCAFAGIGLAVLALEAPAQQVTPTQPQPAVQPQPTARQDPARVQELGRMPSPIDNLSDLRDSARLAFMVADFDNDGLISQAEATNAAQMVVGGLFFAADQNGDGAVTQQEARQVREMILQEQPLLRILVQEARQQAGQTDQAQNPFQGVASLLDTNNDRQLQASEVRGAVETAVAALYQAADTNRDGQMSPGEVNAAAIGLVRAAGDASFRLADTDNNGQIGKDEFQAALMEPANYIFNVVDVNSDGQITRQEAQTAQQVLMNQLMPRIPRGGLGPVPDVRLPANAEPPARPGAAAPAGIPPR